MTSRAPTLGSSPRACFEGQAEANPLAQRGHPRDHRPDCKQVCIALVVTFDGFLLGYEVFAGNPHDSRTLQTIVATMEARHGGLRRVWIAGRGMASADNPAWLRQTGRLARDPRRGRGQAHALCRDRGDGDLCRSAERRSKERAMREKFSRRIEAALERLAARIARSRKRRDPTPVNRQIGRILQQNRRAGLGNAPRAVLQELARIQSHDVVLPTPTHGGLRLRCVTQPDAAQAALLDRLGIVLPKRMCLSQCSAPNL